MMLNAGVPVCTECMGDGRQPEKIAVVGIFKDLDAVEQFWDREGRFHWHDPAPPMTTYECDRLHRWDVQGPSPVCATCSGVGEGEMRFVGLATQERFCVFNEEQQLIGVSLHVEGYERHRLMVPVNTAPDGSMSLAWPAR